MRPEKEIFFRYGILLLLGISNAFYFLFAPLTAFLLKALLSVRYEVLQFGNLIFFDGTAIELIEACIASSAYYLLAILNLTTRDLAVTARLKIFACCAGAFLFLNVARIYGLALLYAKHATLFYLAHTFFLYAVSLVLVAGIWLLAVKAFHIKKIPIWADICFLRKRLRKLKRKKAAARK